MNNENATYLQRYIHFTTILTVVRTDTTGRHDQENIATTKRHRSRVRHSTTSSSLEVHGNQVANEDDGPASPSPSPRRPQRRRPTDDVQCSASRRRRVPPDACTAADLPSSPATTSTVSSPDRRRRGRRRPQDRPTKGALRRSRPVQCPGTPTTSQVSAASAARRRTFQRRRTLQHL